MNKKIFKKNPKKDKKSDIKQSWILNGTNNTELTDVDMCIEDDG